MVCTFPSDAGLRSEHLCSKESKKRKIRHWRHSRGITSDHLIVAVTIGWQEGGSTKSRRSPHGCNPIGLERPAQTVPSLGLGRRSWNHSVSTVGLPRRGAVASGVPLRTALTSPRPRTKETRARRRLRESNGRGGEQVKHVLANTENWLFLESNEASDRS
jgi:hypothetical protein